MDIYLRHFEKIVLLSNMALDIAAFGESQGIFNLVERLDLTCGALPSDQYEQVIDQGAPEPFLELYTRMAEHRFAFAVTELLKLNPAYMTALENYCRDKGKTLKAAKLSTVEAAYELINTSVLDGMPWDDVKNVTVVETNRIVWKKLKETHQEAWQKAGGNLEIYYQLQNCFIQGLLDGSSILFNNEQNELFTLSIEPQEA